MQSVWRLYTNCSSQVMLLCLYSLTEFSPPCRPVRDAGVVCYRIILMLLNYVSAGIHTEMVGVGEETSLVGMSEEGVGQNLGLQCKIGCSFTSSTDS